MKSKIVCVLMSFMLVMMLFAACSVENPNDLLASAPETQSAAMQGTASEAIASGTAAGGTSENMISVEEIEGAAAGEEDYSRYEDNTSTVVQEGGYNHYEDAGFTFSDEDGDGRDDATGLDQYLTDPTPEGRPAPIEPQDVTVNTGAAKTVTLSIRMDTILNNIDKLDSELLYMLDESPTSEGVIYEQQQVTFYEGESVFDVLLRETQANGIHMEFSFTPLYNSHYIEGINNFYEFSAGELSGWMYSVNGWYPNYGCSRYMLQDGDVIEWSYTCDLGRDLPGAEWVGGIQ